MIFIQILYWVAWYMICGLLHSKGIVESWGVFVFLGFVGTRILDIVLYIEAIKEER